MHSGNNSNNKPKRPTSNDTESFKIKNFKNPLKYLSITVKFIIPNKLKNSDNTLYKMTLSYHTVKNTPIKSEIHQLICKDKSKAFMIENLIPKMMKNKEKEPKLSNLLMKLLTTALY